jgi:hypothetical protein
MSWPLNWCAVALPSPLYLQPNADPVELGLVDSLSHPSGNATGVPFLAAGLTAGTPADFGDESDGSVSSGCRHDTLLAFNLDFSQCKINWPPNGRNTLRVPIEAFWF